MGDKLAQLFAKEVTTFKYLPPDDSLTKALKSDDAENVADYPDYDISEEFFFAFFSLLNTP
jgi:hypothetical protein